MRSALKVPLTSLPSPLRTLTVLTVPPTALTVTGAATDRPVVPLRGVTTSRAGSADGVVVGAGATARHPAAAAAAAGCLGRRGRGPAGPAGAARDEREQQAPAAAAAERPGSCAPPRRTPNHLPASPTPDRHATERSPLDLDATAAPIVVSAPKFR